MRRKGKTDSNQKEIVAALRGIGATVNITSSLGDGFPDLVVSFENRWFLVEIKDGDRPTSEKQLTADEEKFHAEQRSPVYTIYDRREALLLLNNKEFRENKYLDWKTAQTKYFATKGADGWKYL